MIAGAVAALLAAALVVMADVVAVPLIAVLAVTAGVEAALLVVMVEVMAGVAAALLTAALVVTASAVVAAPPQAASNDAPATALVAATTWSIRRLLNPEERLGIALFSPAYITPPPTTGRPTL